MSSRALPISVKDFLAAQQRAPRGHRLDPLRADILQLRAAGMTYREIYDWLLEHRPLYSTHVRATATVKGDIDTLGAYVVRVERGEVGRKRGRPRKDTGRSSTASISTTRAQPVPNAAPIATPRPVSPAAGSTDAREQLRATLTERRERMATGSLKFGDDPKSDPKLAPLLSGIKNRDPFKRD